MKKAICIVSVVVTASVLAGCASTTIFPEGKNQYSLVTTSSSEGSAEADAKKKAAKYCQKQAKNLVVLSHSTKYQGVNKQNAAMIGVASAFLTGGGNPARSNDDYQVTMKFTCR